jgi:Trk K+ transport system NAD-binding subunit
LRAALRDTFVLIREFRGALLLFMATLLVGGWAWMTLTNRVEPEPVGYVASIYTVLELIFFAADEPFPVEWYREIFFFVMPILGLAILGRGAADFGVMLFNRRSRQQQWEAAVAATFRDHTIICGLGHLGIRVVRELVSLDVERIVVIERNPQVVRVEECRARGIPVIEGDALQPKTLSDAGLGDASAFIVCTNDDLINLQIAMAVREINPEVRLVVRIFQDEFGRQLADYLGFHRVFSASALAAPFFAGAATGTAVTQTFYVEDEVMNMGRMWVHADTALCNMAVGDLERELDMSIVLHQRAAEVDLHPTPDITLEPGDLIVVFGNLGGLTELTKLNRRKR